MYRTETTSRRYVRNNVHCRPTSYDEINDKLHFLCIKLYTKCTNYLNWKLNLSNNY